ncbi:MAG TPA: cell wall-binding repeat-containing protein, partial [Thermoplasmatales archaeon]|nr:cell wall-binding repeat-containing protein [Thermoplasmatales archaeon]
MFEKGIGRVEVAVFLVMLMLLSTFLPAAVVADSNIKNTVKGYDKGVSWANVVPLKKVTFVNFDENSYLDDYSYLASVPTTVFYDKNDGRLFSYPLLFYQDPYPVKEDKERSLNARQGLDYFMEDWMSYCNGRLDGMTLINVDKNKVTQWPSRNTTSIVGDNPFEIAAEIALHDWSYSDNAVVAVIKEDFEKEINATVEEFEGTLPTGNIIEKTFFTKQMDRLNPRFHEFEIPEGYKYLKTRTWWASFYIDIGDILPPSLPFGANITFPAADPDSQLYYRDGDQWVMAKATQGWNIEGMDLEKEETYVYKSGPWLLGITDIPTFGFTGKYGSFKEILSNLKGSLKREATYQTDITIFPGVERVLPSDPPFGCRDAYFKLTWDNPNVKLGFSLIGPSGEEIVSASNESRDYQEMYVDRLGECLPGEHYSISVFAMGNVSTPVDYRVEYSWHQNISKIESDALTSATEGAVLASVLNAPLLYVSMDRVPECTKEVLYKLGVKNVYLVDIGGRFSTDVKNELRGVAGIKEE